MASRETTIRRGLVEDIPLWAEIAKLRYPGRDVTQAMRWVEWCINNPERLVLVGSATAGIAAITIQHGITRTAHLSMFFTVPGQNPGLEPVDMLKIMINWAKQNGAEGSFKIMADTGVDLGPFVKRAGGRRIELPFYEIPL